MAGIARQKYARRSTDDAGTRDAEEIARFDAHAADWWREDGKFQPLHRLNPLRLAYIRDAVCGHTGRGAAAVRPLAGLRTLDAGCGGGILSEPLARMGAQVTGVDASSGAVKAARQHALAAELAIDYRQGAVEDLAAQGEKYDLVCALEIVEHVASPDAFVAALAAVTRPGGLLVMSTLNRTAQSYLLGILAAEYVLGWAPRGTHDWRKFMRPSELATMLDKHGFCVANVSGMIFKPLSGSFALSTGDLKMNYILSAVRRAR